MAKKLLIDTVSVRATVEESADGGSRIKFRGQFAVADKPTSNNRLYSRSLWEREIRRMQRAISERKIYGEVDHPADGRTKLARASHIITALEMLPDGEIVGEAEVMDTPAGAILKGIVRSNGAIGVSSRGYGSTVAQHNGVEAVQEDFQCDTFDCVADPATATAYPSFTQESLVKKTTESNDEFVAEQSHRGVKIEVRSRLKEGKKVFVALTNASSSMPVSFGEYPTLEEAVSAVRQSIDLMMPQTESSDPKEGDPKTENAPAVTDEPEQVKAEACGGAAATDDQKVEETADGEEKPKVECGDDMDTMESLKAENADLKARIATLESEMQDKVKIESKLAEQVATLTENARGYDAATRELGFAVWIDRECGTFSDAQLVRKSLGRLARFESLDALKAAAAPLIAEAKAKVEAKRKLATAATEALAVENRQLKESNKRLLDRTKAMKEEQDATQAKLHEALLAVWLEKRMHGSPLISEARVRFMRTEKKTQATVEEIVKDLTRKPALNEAVSLKTVRSRFANGGKDLPEGLVEGAVGSARPAAKGSPTIVIGENMEMGIEDFRTLAGVKQING